MDILGNIVAPLIILNNKDPIGFLILVSFIPLLLLYYLESLFLSVFQKVAVVTNLKLHVTAMAMKISWLSEEYHTRTFPTFAVVLDLGSARKEKPH